MFWGGGPALNRPLRRYYSPMAHEDLTREEQVEGSSDRNFGFVFAVVFVLIAAWPVMSGRPLRWWALIIAAAFVLVALAKPALLATPNRLWTQLGVLLGKVVSPIALGILFYGVFAPMAVVARLIGKDPLRLRLDAAADSYWIQRDPPGPPPKSMTNQF
jgi:Saxitoxin biosynthesis operon protein SxtJ